MRPCPFCSGDEIKLKQHTLVRTHAEIAAGQPQHHAAWYECGHCCARGSQFVGNIEPVDEYDNNILESALEAWNGEHQ